MKCVEYGPGNGPAVMLLHGGGLSWWNYREAAELLQTDCRVILPILDGHAGSDRPFTTIEDNAEELLAYIDERLNGSLLLLGGLSLGAQVLLEMLSRRGDLCRFALVESAMVLPSPLTRALIGPAIGSSFGLIRRRWFARLQFQSLHIRPELFGDYYRDTCRIAKADMIAFMKANAAYELKDSLRQCRAKTLLYAGSRETRGIRRSAELLRENLPDCTLTILPGSRHGDFSLNHTQDYVSAIRSALKQAGV